MTRPMLACALVLLGAGVRPAPAQQAGTDDPARVVHALFDAMRAADTAAMRALFHPEARLVTTGSDDDGRPVIQAVAIDRWLGGVARSTRRLDERLYDVETRVSDGLATVWAEYDLYVDSTFSHCGVDAFQLGRHPDGWLIVQVADTRRTDGCPGRRTR